MEQSDLMIELTEKIEKYLSWKFIESPRCLRQELGIINNGMDNSFRGIVSMAIRSQTRSNI